MSSLLLACPSFLDFNYLRPFSPFLESLVDTLRSPHRKQAHLPPLADVARRPPLFMRFMELFSGLRNSDQSCSEAFTPPLPSLRSFCDYLNLLLVRGFLVGVCPPFCAITQQLLHPVRSIELSSLIFRTRHPP